MSMMRIPGGEEDLAAFLKAHPNVKVRTVNRMSAHDQATPAGRPTGVIETQPRVKPIKERSRIEQQMSDQIKEAGLQPPIEWPSQHKPFPDRKFVVDFAWPDIKLVLEVDGAVHRIKGTFKSQFERGFYFLRDGWRVLHVGGDDVRGGAALYWLKELMGRNGNA